MPFLMRQLRVLIGSTADNARARGVRRGGVFVVARGCNEWFAFPGTAVVFENGGAFEVGEASLIARAVGLCGCRSCGRGSEEGWGPE